MASTSTKNPDYRDVFYVEELIGRIPSIPSRRKHWLPFSIMKGPAEPGGGSRRALQVLADLEALDISMTTVTRELEEQGVKSFSDSFTVLLEAIEKRRQTAVTG